MRSEIYDRYYGNEYVINEDPVRRGVIIGFSNLVDGTLSPDLAKRMHRDADMRKYLLPEDYATWKRMTS